MRSPAVIKWVFAGNIIMFLALAGILIGGFKPQHDGKRYLIRLK